MCFLPKKCYFYAIFVEVGLTMKMNNYPAKQAEYAKYRQSFYSKRKNEQFLADCESFGPCVFLLEIAEFCLDWF